MAVYACFLAVSGYIWLYLVVYGYIWPYMAVYDGCVWLHMAIYGCLSLCMAVYGCIKLHMAAKMPPGGPSSPKSVKCHEMAIRTPKNRASGGPGIDLNQDRDPKTSTRLQRAVIQ